MLNLEIRLLNVESMFDADTGARTRVPEKPVRVVVLARDGSRALVWKMDAKSNGFLFVTVDRLGSFVGDSYQSPETVNWLLKRAHRIGIWQPERPHKLHKPCSECPFSRTAVANGTRGADPLIYIGQAFGPFWLPCHSDDPVYQETQRCGTDTAVAQCAGAAIFRENVEVADDLPCALHKLPANRELVFSYAAELLAAHAGISINEAEAFVNGNESKLRDIELAKQEVKRLSPVE